MIHQAIAFILLSSHAASAWSVVRSARPSLFRCGVLANIGSLYSSSALSMANTDDGECADSSSLLSRKPKSGDVVTFTLLEFQPSGDDVLEEPLFDTAGTLKLVLNGGNYLPGLHKLLSTMSPGETVRGSTIDAGYGGYNKELVFQISTSDVGAIDTSLVQIGTVLQMGNGLKCRVTEMNDDKWTLDANHVMAGASYKVDVKLESVEEGPKNWDYVQGKGTDEKYKVATFALGCFWGGELAFQRMPGIVSSAVGYTQGNKENPTYEEVCTGTTGNTEAIQVVYDPDVVSYESLVQLGLDRLGGDVYKLNQVGNDRGTQYRHGIYFHDDNQRNVAEKILESYKSEDRVVMTELKEAEKFYMAEDYHQQYLLKGGQSAKKNAEETIRCYG